MKITIIENGKVRLNNIIDWLLYMVGYTLVLILVSVIFNDTFILDNSYFGLWAFITSIIIYILNKTIKPIIFLLTLPITGLTLGLFYPFINVLIIKMADFILGEHLETYGIFILFFAAILISLMNFLLQKLIIEPIIGRSK